MQSGIKSKMVNFVDFITVNNVTKTFKGFTDPVLLDLSLSIHQGEIICLFGPNGCGKSTFLSLLSGIDVEYNGQIFIDGKTPQLTKTGIVPQYCNDTLLSWRTVLENIAFPLEINGINRSTREEQVRDFLKKANISLPLYLYPSQISGGQQQITAILQALIQRPEFIILDEPFSSLDTKHVKDIQHAIITLWKLTNTTIIFTTHDLLNALFFSDRIIMLSPRPAKVLLESEISLPRPRSYQDPKLLDLFDDIQHKYIELGGLSY